jgi:hypothetical protein
LFVKISDDERANKAAVRNSKRTSGV